MDVKFKTPFRSVNNVVINSYDRTTGDATYFRLFLNQVKENIKAISLISAIIPNSIYNIYNYTAANGIPYYNNELIFYEGATPITINLTPGSYNITDLQAYLSSVMTANTVSGNIYTATYNTVTLKLEVLATGAAAPWFFGFSDNVNNNPSYVLGFSDVSGTLATSQISDKIVRLDGPPYLFLKISQMQSNCFNTENDSAAFTIPFNVNGTNIVYYEPTYSSITRFEFKQETHLTLTYIDVALVDDAQRVVSLEGAEWSFAMHFEYYDINC